MGRELELRLVRWADIQALLAGAQDTWARDIRADAFSQQELDRAGYQAVLKEIRAAQANRTQLGPEGTQVLAGLIHAASELAGSVYTNSVALGEFFDFFGAMDATVPGIGALVRTQEIGVASEHEPTMGFVPGKRVSALLQGVRATSAPRSDWTPWRQQLRKALKEAEWRIGDPGRADAPDIFTVLC